MKVKQGQQLKVIDTRKGIFIGEAIRDFDTDNETFYPIKLGKGQYVSGLNTDWYEGDEIPCRNSLCQIFTLEG